MAYMTFLFSFGHDAVTGRKILRTCHYWLVEKVLPRECTIITFSVEEFMVE